MEGLETPGAGIEGLRRGLHRRAGANGLDVAIGCAQVPPSATGAVRVRGAAETSIVVLIPVEEVVARLVAGARPVRHLVVRQASSSQQVVGEFVLVRLVVVVGMAVGLRRQRRPGFDGESVGRDVRRLERQRCLDGATPVVDRFACGAVDQVEVERRHARRLDRIDGPLDVALIVRAPERHQHVCGHRLHTETHPVHAGCTIDVEHVDGDVVGVALDGDLGIVGDRDRGDHVGQRRWRYERRGATAHEDGVSGGQFFGDSPFDLDTQCLEVRLHEVATIGPRGERAVLALRRAERDVYVHPEVRRRTSHSPSQPPSDESSRDLSTRKLIASEIRNGSSAGGDEEEVERSEALGDLVDGDVQHRRDGTDVITAHGDHSAVEVLALHLDQLEVPGEHLERRTLELHQLRDIDGQLLDRRRGQRGRRLGAGDLAGQELLDGHRVELREPVEAGHRQCPLATLVGTEHRGLELLVRLGLDLLQRHPLLFADHAESFTHLLAVRRWCFFVDHGHLGSRLAARVIGGARRPIVSYVTQG